MTRTTATFSLIALAALLTVGMLVVPRISQPLDYHNFADQRSFLGIPNFGDVTSNLPFALVGLWGFVALPSFRFQDKRERYPYFLVFLGLFLTAFGSSYYHLSPNNARLLWDRLPMTIVFMSLVSAVIAERISLKAGLCLAPPLLALGIGSVLLWYRSELLGAGDLRLYAAVQIYAGLVLLMALAFPAKYTRSRDLGVVVGFYALAKLLETLDRPIFAALHLVSGHTLKHLAGGAAGYWILRMLQNRREVTLNAEC
ncbi:MAG TPA: hypothetical protein VH088_23175 [Terriglobales bacterium]|jgi:hypothetical protein|nr:hypothetical protein [Terriglobales bacterium]